MHRRTLQKERNETLTKDALHSREELVKKAKEAWKKQQEGSKDSGEYIILDLSVFCNNLSGQMRWNIIFFIFF